MNLNAKIDETCLKTLLEKIIYSIKKILRENSSGIRIDTLYEKLN